MDNEKQFIYIISNPAWKDWYKVGKTIHAVKRLCNYQTSSPFRDYKLEFLLEVSNAENHEDYFRSLKTNDDNGEWVKGKLATIIYTIQVLEFGTNKWSIIDGLQKRINVNYKRRFSSKRRNAVKLEVYTKKFID